MENSNEIMQREKSKHLTHLLMLKLQTLLESGAYSSLQQQIISEEEFDILKKLIRLHPQLENGINYCTDFYRPGYEELKDFEPSDYDSGWERDEAIRRNEEELQECIDHGYGNDYISIRLGKTTYLNIDYDTTKRTALISLGDHILMGNGTYDRFDCKCLTPEELEPTKSISPTLFLAGLSQEKKLETRRKEMNQQEQLFKEIVVRKMQTVLEGNPLSYRYDDGMEIVDLSEKEYEMLYYLLRANSSLVNGENINMEQYGDDRYISIKISDDSFFNIEHTFYGSSMVLSKKTNYNGDNEFTSSISPEELITGMGVEFTEYSDTTVKQINLELEDLDTLITLANRKKELLRLIKHSKIALRDKQSEEQNL